MRILKIIAQEAAVWFVISGMFWTVFHIATRGLE